MSAQDGEAFRIDFHHHIVPDFYRAAMERAGVHTVGRVTFPAWSETQMLDNFEHRHIKKALLSVSAPGVSFVQAAMAEDLARQCNDFSVDLRTQYPGRVGGFATLPLPDLDAALREYERTRQLAFEGVILLTNYHGVYLSDPRIEPMLAELNGHKALVFVHPNVPPGSMELGMKLEGPIIEFTFDTTRVMVDMIVRGLIDKYPDIRWVLAHFGGTLPFLAGRLRTVDETPRANYKEFQARGRKTIDYLKTFYYDSALSASPTNLRLLKDLVGADRMVFGTDTPLAVDSLITYNTGNVDSAVDPETSAALNFGNAERLLKGLR